MSTWIKTVCVAFLLLLATDCSNPSGGGSQTGTLSFVNVRLELLSFGQSNNTFSVSPHRIRPKALVASSSRPSSYYSALLFDFADQTTAILGFDVYRSSDGINFAKIGSQNYGAMTSEYDLGASFEFDDYDATLVLGTTYYYKVQAFNASGSLSNFSPQVGAAFIKPFTISLVTPTNGAQLSGVSPSLTFSISDTSLWSASVSDYFYCSVFVKDKNGSPAYYGEFRYKFSGGKWQAPGSYSANSGVSDWTSPITVASGIGYSGGTITVDLSSSAVVSNNDSYVSSNYGNFALLQGNSYEWDIFGDWAGTGVDDIGTSDAMDPAYFTKSSAQGSGATGYGVSYANTYDRGNGSINGSFDFGF